MKKVLFLMSLVLCLSPRAQAQTGAPAPAVQPGVTAEAPKFLPDEVTGRELRDLAGRAFRLGDFRGRAHLACSSAARSARNGSRIAPWRAVLARAGASASKPVQSPGLLRWPDNHSCS